MKNVHNLRFRGNFGVVSIHVCTRCSAERAVARSPGGRGRCSVRFTRIQSAIAVRVKPAIAEIFTRIGWPASRLAIVAVTLWWISAADAQRAGLPAGLERELKVSQRERCRVGFDQNVITWARRFLGWPCGCIPYRKPPRHVANEAPAAALQRLGGGPR